MYLGIVAFINITEASCDYIYYLFGVIINI